MKENRVRHMQNLLRLHGVFYHGRYYHHGLAQPHAGEDALYSNGNGSSEKTQSNNPEGFFTSQSPKRRGKDLQPQNREVGALPPHFELTDPPATAYEQALVYAAGFPRRGDVEIFGTEAREEVSR